MSTDDEYHLLRKTIRRITGSDEAWVDTMLWICAAAIMLALGAYDFGYRRGRNASYDELDEYLNDMHYAKTIETTEYSRMAEYIKVHRFWDGVRRGNEF
jgi:hypothetical protein